MMPAPATKLEVTDRPSPPEAIADFTRGFSLEATRPSADDVDALAAIAPAGTHVYLSAVWTRPPQEVVAAAALLRRAGLEPVPHLAVRNIASVSALDEFLAELAAEAGVRRLLVIAGDSDKPAGAFRSAIEVIDGGALRRHGITEIGIAGYPDGHPRVSQQDLDRALADKINAAETTGMAVRVGLAGPTSLATLLRYAKRCGVRASAQGLARQAGLLRQLFAMSTPDALVRTLAERRGELGEIAPHFFSFGGLALTARWAAAVAERRIAIEGCEGFRVEPPK
jgi:methylenetetrahydrofolate reductase (NADPH)